MATATSNTLRLKFKDGAGANKTVNFSNAKATATASQVKALADGCVTNGLIWAAVPAEKVSAAMVTTTTTDIDISD